MTGNRREERPLETAPERAAGHGAPDGDPSVDEGAAKETESDARAADAGGARFEGGVARAASAAAGVVRGSANVTREGVAAAQRAVRVTYWPAQLCVLAAILLQVALPSKLVVGPSWLLPALEGALLIGLWAATAGHTAEDHPARRRVAIGLIALVNAANAASLYLLAHELLHKHIAHGRPLILSGMAIWLTNVLIFALWYWQLDRGGPANRARHPDPTTPEGQPDFVFPEMDTGVPFLHGRWAPGFVDYLALALTTATAFSPTDTMPISRPAKALMNAQALISLVTLGLIISRAVGILS